MTNVLITKNSFSRVKKALKTSLLSHLGVDAKLSEVSQVLSSALGFASEHELQKHFEKEASTPETPALKSLEYQQDNPFVALDIYVNNEAYFKARTANSNSIRLDDPLLRGEVHVVYHTEEEGYLNKSDASRKTVYTKVSELVSAANASRHGDTHYIEIFWQKPGPESTLTKIEKLIANHFSTQPDTAIQKLCFDYADYGLDLFVLAMNKENTDIEGFGFYYSDDISKYKQREMDRLGFTQKDKELIDNLLEISGLNKSNSTKEQVSSELKYEIANKLGLKNMNASLLDTSNYFEYELYSNEKLINVCSIYPHGLFKPKMNQIKINPALIPSVKEGYRQFIEYDEKAHSTENSIFLKLPVYTAFFNQNTFKYLPLSWVQKALKN